MNNVKHGARLRVKESADTRGAHTAEVDELRHCPATRLSVLNPRELYEIGDLPRAEYIARRDAIHVELSTLAPQPLPDLGQARQVLQDFAMFWRDEEDPTQSASSVFEGIWLDDHRVIAVQPKPAFLPSSTYNAERRRSRRG